MSHGAPGEARWVRREPRRSLPAPDLERIVRTAFPRGQVAEIQSLGDGMRNSNFKFRFDSSPDWFVLRIYEHDPSLCRKELDLMRLVAGAIPSTGNNSCEPAGSSNFPPFTLSRFVDGISFRDLRRGGDLDSIAQASYSAGETLAAIGRFTFEKPGWLAPGPTVGRRSSKDATHSPVLSIYAFRPRIFKGASLGFAARAHTLAWSCAPQFSSLENENHLVHGDFNKRNVLVSQKCGDWSVAAILDWEFAVSGTPLGRFRQLSSL